MRFSCLAVATLILPLAAQAGGNGSSGELAGPPSLKPSLHVADGCRAGMQVSQPLPGLRVTRGFGPAQACQAAAPPAVAGVSVDNRQTVIVRQAESYGFGYGRRGYSTSPYVLGAPQPRRY